MDYHAPHQLNVGDLHPADGAGVSLLSSPLWIEVGLVQYDGAVEGAQDPRLELHLARIIVEAELR